MIYGSSDAKSNAMLDAKYHAKVAIAASVGFVVTLIAAIVLMVFALQDHLKVQNLWEKWHAGDKSVAPQIQSLTKEGWTYGGLAIALGALSLFSLFFGGYHTMQYQKQQGIALGANSRDNGL